MLAATFALYAPALHNDFCYDDRFVAMGHDGGRRHPLIAELRPLTEYFSSHWWRGVEEHGTLYRPVAVLAFALRHAVAGDDARVAHLINVLLHCGATLLVYLLVRELNARPGPAALGALCFGAHAIHSEAVVAISGLAELLAFGAGATGLLLLVRARGPAAGQGAGDGGAGAVARRVACRAGAACSLFLAFGAKESALAWVPFAAGFGLAVRCARGGAGRLVRPALLAELAAVVIPLAVYLALRARMLDQLPASVAFGADAIANPLFAAPALQRVLGALVAWGLGLLLTVFPFWLSADWGAAVLPLPRGFGDPAALLAAAAAAALVALGAIGLCALRRRPLVFAAAASFLLFGALTSNLAFPIGTVFAERLYYASSLAVPCAVAAAAAGVAARGNATVLAALALGAWLGANALVIGQRTAVWRDDATLILHEAAHQPHSAQMRFHAARVHAARGEAVAALDHVEAAVALASRWPPAVRFRDELRAFVQRSPLNPSTAPAPPRASRPP